MFVAVDGSIAGIVAVADPIKDGAAQVIHELRAHGPRVIRATGENERPEQVVAGKRGIDAVRAGVLPEDKKTLIDQLRKEGHKTAMAGDGVNSWLGRPFATRSRTCSSASPMTYLACR